GDGVLVGVERVSHPGIGIGGSYGTWGESYDNEALFRFIEQHFSEPLRPEERMDLSSLGFARRHHIPFLTKEEHLELEVDVGARFLQEAARACGWKPTEVEGVLIGMSGPVADDYTVRIADRAGIPKSALKISIHKACDSSMSALHMILNPELAVHQKNTWNIAEKMYGKKVLVGGIEGLSRFVMKSRDRNAMQLFGNGAGVIGVIPGQTMKFLVGKSDEVFDEKGVLAVSMYYPHSGQRRKGQSMVEVSQAGNNHLRVAGLMHVPQNGEPVVMAGPMGMVKLFVRSGVQVVFEATRKYQALMAEMKSAKEITLGIVHHANLKINQLKAKRLRDLGIDIPMPWVISEFGNVSAASNMIAFLRKLPSIKTGEHILFDGFGAGTYYDAFAVALGE
ncbi:MAG: 3-oxoacyl-[acyl-carrier-protein] synthase III C-terminal domain-containing protein, partial [Anaerolineales bacterium]